MAKVDPGSTGMLVSRLVEEMAQTSFDDHEDIASVKKLAKGIGLKEISAFVPDRRAPRSNAATNKAKQRDKNKRKQCNVEVTEEVRSTIQALAKAIKADPAVHTVVRSLVSDEKTRQIIEVVLTAIAADREMYVTMPEAIQLCKTLSEQGADISGIVEMAKAGDLIRIMSVLATKPSLIENVLKWNGAGDGLVSTFESIFEQAEHGVADPNTIQAAMVAASRRPDDVLRFVSASQGGGLRGRLLGWLLGARA